MEPLTAADPAQVGAYRLQARLGTGGMGHVYLGFSPAGRAVAVKVIHPQLADNREFVARFGREVAAARVVSGAYTAPVVAAGPNDRPPWLATAFVAGPSLDEVVTVSGPLPPAPVWRLTAGLAEALADIHGCGLVHRDLKPANVLLAIDGPRVIDFGIAHALEGSTLTATGLTVGTPGFMSPEQIKGARVGPASDVFSLGSLIVFASAGSGAFGGGSVEQLMYRVVHGQPALETVPGGLRELAAACLAKDPAHRPTLPEVMDVILAASPRSAISLESFWPDTVATLIGAHQAHLGEWLTGDQERHLADECRLSDGHLPTATVSIVRAGAGDPGHATADTGAVPGAGRGAGGTGRPGGGRHSRPTGNTVRFSRQAQHVIESLDRRQVLAGLAGTVAIGLGVMGWELAQGGADRQTGAMRAGIQPTSGKRPSAARHNSGKVLADQPAPGSEVWSSGLGGGAFSTPAVSGNVVYFAGNTNDPRKGGALYALGERDGAMIWRSDIGGGLSTEPVVADSIICFVGNDAALYGLDTGSGTQVWTSDPGGGAATEPALADGVLFLGGSDDRLYAVRAADGTQLWRVGTSAGLFTVPAVAGGAVIFGGNDSRLYAVRAADGSLLWSVPTIDGFIAKAVVGDGVVFFGGNNDQLYAVRASDGANLWNSSVAGKALTLPATAEGVVYFGGSDSTVYALGAADGTKLWSTRIGGEMATYPVVADGVVYIGGTDGELYALRATSGAHIWSTDAGQGPGTDPVVADGVIYFGGNNGRLYALNI
jgi:outer membrane protein assembly factor BamB